MPGHARGGFTTAAAVDGVDFAILERQAAQAMRANKSRRTGDENALHAARAVQRPFKRATYRVSARCSSAAAPIVLSSEGSLAMNVVLELVDNEFLIADHALNQVTDRND